MSVETIVLLADSGKSEDYESAANGIAALLELKSPYQPIAQGEPCKISVMHASAQSAQAQKTSDVLSSAGCDVSVTAKDADPAAIKAAIQSDSAKVFVVVGGLPNLQQLGTSFGVQSRDAHFANGGGVVLMMTSDKKDWVLVHVIDLKKNWWMQGGSSYTPAE